MPAWINMRKGIYFNRWLEERMILVVGSGIILGAICHRYLVILKPFIPYIFAYMTLAMAINCSPSDFRKTLQKPGLPLGALLLLHGIMPLFATVMAHIFLPGVPKLQAGIILGTAAPIGVAATIWTGIAGGDIALALTTVILDTLLSPLVVPLIMTLTIGKSVQFDLPQLMLGLSYMIVLPTLVGILLNHLSQGRVSRRWRHVAGPSTKLLLAVVVATNLAVAWASLDLFKSALPRIIVLVLIMSCSGFLLGYIAAKLAKLPVVHANTYVYIVGIRNITAGLVMALRYFPEITAIPVVFATIFQQPLAALSHRMLIHKK